MRLEANQCCKQIKGKPILTDITLSLKGGMIYGFTGPNGCGKTMLFRALAGLMSLTSGSVSLDGKQLKKDFSVLPDLGIILENTSLYGNLTGFENLRYLAGFRKKAGNDEIRKAILRVGLDPEDKRTYGKYSLGMKQRLAIAQAVMEQPAIIMLDEPTNSLDQSSVASVRKIIQEEKERGTLILLASHNAQDIEILADHVFGIENGRIVKGG